MKTKIVNRANVEGILYQHSLEERVSGENSHRPGTKFIRGTIEIATDNKKLNIVPITYTYITETTKNGKPNSIYTALKHIVDGDWGCYTNPDVLDNAAKLRVSSTVGLSDYYTNRNGEITLNSYKQCQGGFINKVEKINEDEKARSEFTLDVVITAVTDKEEVIDDNGTMTNPHHVDLDCRAFGYNNALLPMHLTALNEGAMDYFLRLDISKKEPMFTQVKGQIVNQQLERKIYHPSAFGEDDVQIVPYTSRDFVVTWAKREPYVFGEDVTFEELSKLNQERENYLATRKINYEDYQSHNQGVATTAPTPAIPKEDDDDFDF